MAEDPASGQPVGEVVEGWSWRPPFRAVALSGRHVDLEPLALEHADELRATLARPEDEPLWTYRPHPRPRDVGGMRALLVAHLDRAGLEPADLETVVLRPREGPMAGRAAGLVSGTRIEPDHGQVELAGVLFAVGLQRTRAATEAVHLLMAHAFEDLGYRRVEWKCDSLNEPSRRAAARLGFVAEGRFRRHLVVKGRNRDTDWFSVTDEEWAVVGAAQRAWLAPANFDPEGRQRRSLGDLRDLGDLGDPGDLRDARG